jgi:selT/selW/selH-like putative selenoprotein
LADSIRERLGVQPELIEGRNGVFEIHLDGQPMFSKRQLGRFPAEGEIEDLLSEKLGS